MATLSGTATLRFRDGEWKTLGRSRLVAGSLVCTTGLAEGQDFEVEVTNGAWGYLGRIRRLRAVGDAVHTFTFQHDDRAAEFAAASAERDAATDDLKAQYTAAVNRLDQIGTQMAVINGASSMNAAQQLAAFKSIANAVSDEATILKRTLRLLKSEVS